MRSTRRCRCAAAQKRPGGIATAAEGGCTPNQVISLEQLFFLQDLRTSVTAEKPVQVLSQPRNSVDYLLRMAWCCASCRRSASLVSRRTGRRSPWGPQTADTWFPRGAYDAREVVQLKIGDAAEILMDEYPGRAIDGTITECQCARDKSGMFQWSALCGQTPGSKRAAGLRSKLQIWTASSREASDSTCRRRLWKASRRIAPVCRGQWTDRVKTAATLALLHRTHGVALIRASSLGEHVVDGPARCTSRTRR